VQKREAAADQLLALEWRWRHLDAMGRVRSSGRLEEVRRQIDRAAFLTLRRAELLLREADNAGKPDELAQRLREAEPPSLTVVDKGPKTQPAGFGTTPKSSKP